jgi:glycerol-3-phosphate dehydrogenase
MLDNATHLSGLLPTLTPCYKFWEVPYYWAGMKMYDLVAYASGSSIGNNQTTNINNDNNNNHAYAGQLNSSTHLRSLLVLHDCFILGPGN